jgi:hypothetical protein
MSDILKKAHEIHAEQTKAEENAEADRLRRDRELTEAQMIGAERAQQFVQLMVEHDIPAEDFFTKTYKERRIRNSGYIYDIAGKGWSIRVYSDGYDSPTIPGLAILEDSSVHEWIPIVYADKGGRKAFESSDDCSKVLANDDGLNLLGRKVVELGIIE